MYTRVPSIELYRPPLTPICRAVCIRLLTISRGYDAVCPNNPAIAPKSSRHMGDKFESGLNESDFSDNFNLCHHIPFNFS